jgi:hypothetical protein
MNMGRLIYAEKSHRDSENGRSHLLISVCTEPFMLYFVPITGDGIWALFNFAVVSIGLSM